MAHNAIGKRQNFYGLKSAQREPVQPRPVMPPLSEMSLNREAMIERFSNELAAQAGVLRRTSGMSDLKRILSEISMAEGIKSVITSNDDTVKSLEVPEWGASNGIEVVSIEILLEREALKEKAFSVDAGLTGAAFAVAESGTIELPLTGICHALSPSPRQSI